MTRPPLTWCAECDDYVHGCAHEHAGGSSVPIAEPTEPRTPAPEVTVTEAMVERAASVLNRVTPHIKHAVIAEALTAALRGVRAPTLEESEVMGDVALEGFIDWCDGDPLGRIVSAPQAARQYLALRRATRAASRPVDDAWREPDRVIDARSWGSVALEVTCSHLPGTVVHDVNAPDAFTHPANWCRHCRLWIRHPAYPAQERGPHDATAPT